MSCSIDYRPAASGLSESWLCKSSVIREKFGSWDTELSSFFDLSIVFTLDLFSLLTPLTTDFGISVVGLPSLFIERPDVGLVKGYLCIFPVVISSSSNAILLFCIFYRSN